jgi:hypothetical protein
VLLTEYGCAQQGTVLAGVGRVAIVEVVDYGWAGIAARGPVGEIAAFEIPLQKGMAMAWLFIMRGRYKWQRVGVGVTVGVDVDVGVGV